MSEKQAQAPPNIITSGPLSWFPDTGYSMVDFKNKQSIVKFHFYKNLNLVQSMLEYKGLPDSIPVRDFKLMLQMNGYTGIVEHKGKLRAVYGTLGGVPDGYYMPTKCIVANPYLDIYKTFEIDNDIIIIRHDPLYLGLTHILDYYSQLMTENVLSKRILTINSRRPNIFGAPNDSDYESCKEFQKKLENGDDVIAVRTHPFGDYQLSSIPFGQQPSSRALTELIEDQQYIKASFLNEFGLNANYNMKRETITANESQLNEDQLVPFPDVILTQQREDLKKVNDKFGTNITVDFSSIWKTKREQADLLFKQMKNQTNNTVDRNNTVSSNEGEDND